MPQYSRKSLGEFDTYLVNVKSNARFQLILVSILENQAQFLLKFMFSKKATKIDKIFTM